MKPISAIIIGAGNRGNAYTHYALENPHELNMVGVADLSDHRRRLYAEEHDIPEERMFVTYQELLQQDRMADIAIITTQDSMHYEPTILALKKGYHVLVEKPMSPNPEECIAMEEAAEASGRQLSVCHVLRYTPFWSGIKKVVESGEIGEIASIQLNENVGYLHMAHSFVRGNWRNSETSSPMILAKSSHDMDIISWIMNKPCTHVSSFGSLMHFRKENAPEGAPPYCLDGCPAKTECAYYAPDYYLNRSATFMKKIADDNTREGVLEALRKGPYGRCVYQTDNNVVDHQVVNLLFEGGGTATFSMSGLTQDTTRSVQIMGTKGEIRGMMKEKSFSVFNYLTKSTQVFNLNVPPSGHSGGDVGIIRSFLQEIRQFNGSQGLTSAHASVESHMIAFAAEHSRLHQGESVNLPEFERKHKSVQPN